MSGGAAGGAAHEGLSEDIPPEQLLSKRIEHSETLEQEIKETIRTVKQDEDIENKQKVLEESTRKLVILQRKTEEMKKILEWPYSGTR